ncbi:HesB-like protein [Candidatus Blochmanniella floridana]|uniref:Iron-sulfur cluster insertion protein ErpA n=1 Tax=Blochmanniella floridana TaxID=203907 RepID=ERPA_BLOFL|nr:RecName: Full=Iron-sulfur cluster insertion protein ErpA [Candidatus Blochmannia floridanus]CAD83676.1 HesB-like protein [Candidatus Blochmannia floridanus]
MSNDKKNAFPIKLTHSAADQVKKLISSQDYAEKLDLKLRVYILGGGCGGFQYKFILDDQVSNDDCVIESNGAIVVVDPMSLQYLFGGIIDYYEGLEGSKFLVVNPNAKGVCSCGSSFNI